MIDKMHDYLQDQTVRGLFPEAWEVKKIYDEAIIEKNAEIETEDSEEQLYYIKSLEAQLAFAENFATEKIKLCLSLTEQNNKHHNNEVQLKDSIERVKREMIRAKEQSLRDDFNSSTKSFWVYKSETIEDILSILLEDKNK